MSLHLGLINDVIRDLFVYSDDSVMYSGIFMWTKQLTKCFSITAETEGGGLENRMEIEKENRK